MKLGIMQPYFFPYIGYWQLMNAVDKYVVYDDVNFIKGGWINRNRILINGKPAFFNLPLSGSSPNKLINEIYVDQNVLKKRKMLNTIELAYKKAPQFNIVMPIIEEIINFNAEKISSFILNSFKIINKYLGIETELILSSEIDKNNSLRGQDKVISICKIFNATEYYNPIGGTDLYSYEDFHSKGIELKFLKTNEIKYQQFKNEFQPNLSIIDVMMFCSVEQIQGFLMDYQLI
ncbi:MAG: WbqC family protein [Selenomonadaceae bacterium]|nr:WbqC family protein [Selenomonadaceae bacterium]